MTHPTEQASTENVQCELCESKFKNIRGLNAHLGHANKSIPQLVGYGGDKRFNCIYTFESTYV